jgi:hypothetical protein
MFMYRTQRRRDRPELKVEIHGPEGGSDFYSPVLQVSAGNIGGRDIRLKGVAIILKSGEQLVTDDQFTKHDNLPCTLHPWKTEFTASITIDKLYDLLSQRGYSENSLAIVRANLIDIAGKVYEGPCHPYRVKNWKVKSPEQIVYQPISTYQKEARSG